MDSTPNAAHELEQERLDTALIAPVVVDSVVEKSTDFAKKLPPDQLLAYAKTLIGIPYKYASTDTATEVINGEMKSIIPLRGKHTV